MSKSTKINKKSNKTIKNELAVKKKKNAHNSNCKIVEFNANERVEELIIALQDNYAQQKILLDELNKLRTSHNKQICLSSDSRVRSPSLKHSDFNKPVPIPKTLRNLLNIRDDKLPRPKITNLMYEYFTNNDMYNRTTKEIIPDSRIKKIFGMEKGDTITFYNLQSWLRKICV